MTSPYLERPLRTLEQAKADMRRKAMTANQFRNAILLLNCIDATEFEAEMYGTGPGGSGWNDFAVVKWWDQFREDPIKFYIHASDAHRAALWAIIEKRLTKGESNDAST